MLRIARIALILLIIGIYVAIPIAASASGQQVVIITASPYITGGCVQNFSIELVEPFGVHISWTSGNGTGTRVIAKNGGWPASTTDGFIVYDGNGSYVDFATSASSEIMQDVYFHAYTNLGNGTYSVCYATGSITGGTGMTVLGSGVTLIGTIILAFLALACMVSGFHFKQGVFEYAGVIFWLAFIVFAYIQKVATGDTYYVLAGAGVIMMAICAFSGLGVFWREAKEPEETELQKYQKTENPKSESMEEFKKRMGLKGRQTKNKYPWEK